MFNLLLPQVPLQVDQFYGTLASQSGLKVNELDDGRPEKGVK